MKSSSNLERFTNPITHDSAITIRDHFIIKVKSRWFCVGTSNPVWTGHNPMLFSSWTRGYEVGLLKSRNPLGPWEFASREPIFGTRKKGYRPELAASGSYAHLQFDDTEDPYCETGHNALFEGPDGTLRSSCHYLMEEKRPYSQTPEPWERTPQLGFEPVRFRDGIFFITGPTWTRQRIAIGKD